MMKITTKSAIFRLSPDHKLCTLSISNYVTPSLESGIVSLQSNYAKTVASTSLRAFYNRVHMKLILAATSVQRLTSVCIFRTGTVQIAGLTGDEADIDRAKIKLCSIFNECRGTIDPTEIEIHPVYNVYTHGTLVYGESTNDTTVMVPIGRCERDGRLFLHGDEVYVEKSDHDHVVKFRPKVCRRTDDPDMRYDCLGRCDGEPVDMESRKPSLQFKYYAVTSYSPIKLSDWSHSISLINGAMRTKKVDFTTARDTLRRAGFIVSYDPNIYQDMNIKHRENGSHVGTILMTKRGYLRFFGYKKTEMMEIGYQRICRLLLFESS
jgi:hypothetical protein